MKKIHLLRLKVVMARHYLFVSEIVQNDYRRGDSSPLPSKKRAERV